MISYRASKFRSGSRWESIVMRRRAFLPLLGGAALSPISSDFSFAERQKALRVGTVAVGPSEPTYAVTTGSFLRRMAELGYENGRNLILELIPLIRRTEQDYKIGYQELATRGVDIFLAIGLEIALKGAVAAAGTKPVVMVAINWDPVGRGYISSLARPGGNITGLISIEIELTTKRFQLLIEMLPNTRAATVFWDRASESHWREAQVVAAKLGLRIRGVEFKGAPPYDFEGAWAHVTPEYRGALIVLGSPHFAYPERRRLPAFALRHRIPTVFTLREYVDEGGLVSYGPNYANLSSRAADYVHRIANGAKPADLPVQLPTAFDLVVNLKTATAVGVAVPNSMLVRADSLIE
jgi:putative ABC transport system substrate-binding protein